MKQKSFSVASAETNRGEFDVFRLHGAVNFRFLRQRLCSRILTGECQPDVTLDDFTKFVNGNLQFAFQQNLFNLLLKRVKNFSPSRVRRSKCENYVLADKIKSERQPKKENKNCFQPEQMRASLGAAVVQKIINGERCAAGEINNNEVNQVHRRFVEQRLCPLRCKIFRGDAFYFKQPRNKHDKEINWNKASRGVVKCN